MGGTTCFVRVPNPKRVEYDVYITSCRTDIPTYLIHDLWIHPIRGYLIGLSIKELKFGAIVLSKT